MAKNVSRLQTCTRKVHSEIVCVYELLHIEGPVTLCIVITFRIRVDASQTLSKSGWYTFFLMYF